MLSIIAIKLRNLVGAVLAMSETRSRDIAAKPAPTEHNQPLNLMAVTH